MNKRSSELGFPTTAEYTPQDIIRVQNRLLEMAICVKDVLDWHKIPYFLAFGTLLGAVRHKGFVPWDDDFDLFLFDDSYDKAMEILEKELPDHLVVHSRKNDPLYFKAWNSIRDTKTEVVDAGLYHEDHALLGYQCLALDMYRLKKMPKFYVPLYKIEEAILFFQRKLESGLIDNETHSREVGVLKDKLTRHLEDQTDAEDASEVFAFMITLRRPFLIDEILPLSDYMFEGVVFKGPFSSDAVLNSSYGDYRTLPDYDNRKPHYKKVVFR